MHLAPCQWKPGNERIKYQTSENYKNGFLPIGQRLEWHVRRLKASYKIKKRKNIEKYFNTEGRRKGRKSSYSLKYSFQWLWIYFTKKYLSESLFLINHRLFQNCRSWRIWGDISQINARWKMKKVVACFQRKTVCLTYKQ